MGLIGHLEGDQVTVAGDARQRFHDARGYGIPGDGQEVRLAPVEAAHLLFRGDLEAIEAGDDRLDFRRFMTEMSEVSFAARFLVYADLRSRGFYLAPAREPWYDDTPTADFVVFERGSSPVDRSIAYRVRVRGERATLPVHTMEAGVLAVVDEESEVTYFAVAEEGPQGLSEQAVSHDPTGQSDSDLLADRVVLWGAPSALYDEQFYGQPLAGRDGDRAALQCSLLEAAHLAAAGVIDLEAAAIIERGRELEGDRFDRRLAVYRHCREHGVVPKTGYKFGADFRTYPSVTDVEDLGHSTNLVRVYAQDHQCDLREVALDVRLAHGVRKALSLAIVRDDGSVAWRSVERLTP